MVHGVETLKGIVGAVPPHLITGGTDAAYKMDDLCCDVGLDLKMCIRDRSERHVRDVFVLAIAEPASSGADVYKRQGR